MITKKGFNVFVAIFVIGSLEGCLACFSENFTGDVEPIKTGASVLKVCHCEKEGYTVQHIKWINPQGHEVTQLSTNVVEAVKRPGEKLQVVEVDNNELETGTDLNVYTSVIAKENYVSLNIKSMGTSISGTYTCETIFEGVKYTKTFNFEAHDSLYFVNTNVSQHVVIGDDSLISCEARGNLEPIINWHLLQEDNEIQIFSDDKYDITSNGLIISNASKNDGGTYRCTATDITTAELIDRNITVEVTARPHISELKADPGTTILAGTKLSVQCIAEGIPHPEYFWNKITDLRGNALADYNATWQQDVNTIVFDNIQKDDAGTYSCITANYVGGDTSNITIEVKVPPEIIHFENVTATEGSIAKIECSATGESVPNIFISYSVEAGLENDTSIIYKEDLIDNGSQLTVTFMNVSRTYEGVYTCNASNEEARNDAIRNLLQMDTVVKDIYFTVFYKPFFEDTYETLWGWNGKTINMSCEHKSNPPSTIVWKFQGNEIQQHTTTAQQVETNRFIVRLLNNNSEHYMALPVDKNTMYGVYECMASNEHGNSTKFIHLREAYPPGPIKNVTVIKRTATSLTFHIEGPEYADVPPVLGYVAQYDSMDNFHVTNIHRNRTWSLDRKFTIESLEPSTTYLISFAAQNEAGVGVWSDRFVFNTPETSVPEPPVWDENPLGNLRWKLPEANGVPVDYYIIEYCPFINQVINYSLCREEKLTTTEFSLNSLERSRKYRFKIRAHNSRGFSELSSDKDITTPEKLVATPVLTAGGIIGLSVVVVLVCLVLLDLLLLCWRRQGIIASCCLKRNKKKDDNLQSRDKKGLLVKEGERRDGSLTSPNNGHREFEYNKTTGVITGKHSTV